MKIYVLIGKSGTGKSFQAINVCRKYNIESIIDDGLFIYKGKVVAGKSAKREKTKMGAVKTAIFTNDEHKEDVLKKVQEVAPKSLLIIGTSENMIEKIMNRLNLTNIYKVIWIEDITTENERKIANKYRHGLGQHIIPVPTMEIKQQFSGYILSPLRLFKGFGENRAKLEKSLVRPTYSYMGNFAISDRVIGDIVRCVAKDIKGVKNIGKVYYQHSNEGLKIDVIMFIKKNWEVIKVARELQEKSVKMVEEMTAFHIEWLNVEVRR